MRDLANKAEHWLMNSLLSHHKRSNGVQLGGFEHQPWEKHAQSALHFSKLSYAAVLYSVCIHTLILFSISNLSLPRSPTEVRTLLFYTAYVANPEPQIAASADTPATRPAERVLPESPENYDRQAPPSVSQDAPQASEPQSQLHQEQLTAPAVVPAPPPLVRKLVPSHRKIQHIPELKEKHEAVTPDNRQSGDELHNRQAAVAPEPRKNLATAPEVRQQSDDKSDHPARELDVQQFLAANLEDIGGKVMAVLQYPAMAKRMKWQGLSSIGFVLHPSGEVTDLRVAKSSGHAILDKQAIAAVRAAAPFNGAAKEVSVILPVRFHLE